MNLTENVWIGVVTVYMEMPRGWRIPSALDFYDALDEAFEANTELELESPFINGVWALTVKYSVLPEKDIVDKCREVFAECLQEAQND